MGSGLVASGGGAESSPPSLHLHDFLPEDLRQALLDWVLASQARFKAATIVHASSDVLDLSVRSALKLRDLGSLKAALSARLLAALPQILGAIGGRTVAEASLEVELTAYGDGAFYRAHRDIEVGPERKPLGARPGEDRLLSSVYYFHNEPKAFSGGQLRLHRWGAKVGEAAAEDFLDIQPTQNSLVAFPSWATHEVRPVECPSGRFEDYRFALNCWYCAPLTQTAG